MVHITGGGTIFDDEGAKLVYMHDILHAQNCLPHPLISSERVHETW